MLRLTLKISCLIFAKGVSHFPKRHEIRPIWTKWPPCKRNGMQFPPRPQSETVSHSEPQFWDALSPRPQPETVSHSKGKFWDAFSETPSIQKARPTLNASGIEHPPIRPAINKEASSRAAGHEVHREFRTQRRPLNVAFVLRRTVEQGTSCPDAREDVSFRKMDRPPSAMGATPPARPFWRLQPCYPDLPWWGDPLRQPSCRAAS